MRPHDPQDRRHLSGGVKSVVGGVRKLAKFIVSTFIRAAGGTQLVGINSSKLSHELALKNRVNIHMAMLDHLSGNLKKYVFSLRFSKVVKLSGELC